MGKQPGEIYLELNVLYYEDEAVAAAGTDAELLFIRGLCFAKRLLTDGVIGEAQLRTISHGLGDPSAAAARLVELRLWRRRKGGYVITNFLKRNASRAEVHARTTEASRFAAKGNHLRWHTNKPRSDCEFCVAERAVRRPNRAQSSGGDRVPDRGGESGANRVVGRRPESGGEDRSTSTSTTETPSPKRSAVEKKEAPPARARAKRPAAAGESLSFDPAKRPDLAALTARGWRVSQAQADDLGEMARSLELRAIDGMRQIATWVTEAPKRGDLHRYLLDRGNALRAERQAAAEEQQRRRRVDEQPPGAIAEAAAASIGQRPNGHARLSRDEAIAKWKPFRGSIADELLERQIAAYGLTLADLEDPVDFDPPAPEAAHG